jgi:putative FmdB family regulatory protein
MPTYDYKCKQCEHEFEEYLTISHRNDPTHELCPQENCEGEVYMSISAPGIGDPWTHNAPKVDRGFKDRMQEIKRSHPGSSMNIPS